MHKSACRSQDAAIYDFHYFVYNAATPNCTKLLQLIVKASILQTFLCNFQQNSNKSSFCNRFTPLSFGTSVYNQNRNSSEICWWYIAAKPPPSSPAKIHRKQHTECKGTDKGCAAWSWGTRGRDWEGAHINSPLSLLLHVDAQNYHQMWAYFLLDYMTNVFFSRAKHMTRRETDRLNTNLQLNAEKYWMQNKKMVVKVI